MRSVWFTGAFEGFHHWADAPDEVDFLRDRHRHVFHWRVDAPVVHGDRAIEFILAGRAVKRHVRGTWPGGELGSMSCEMVAEEIGAFVRRTYGVAWCLVSVSEDNENGGRVLVGALPIRDAVADAHRATDDTDRDDDDPSLLINILGRDPEAP